ncbi:transcription initiation factor sigma E [[Synechococcus] sp. NIES-970]|uniref:sigma-70 family RNA polymerase sigma factor n=1 Tax=Picosynechococcus sp. NKBG15041c TaxID=1407650 RepID=UPI00041B8FB8|nr:sigma-70 family RNA polymerase sigma factor [Picosynechococcus sp. NKBG15041c]BAW97217.1 transcription initiation factor sigma E [[Synechococcus] sp. NIES-970]
MPDQAIEQPAAISDRELVCLCQGKGGNLRGQRDRQSFRLLYQRYHQKVRSTVYQLCGVTLLDDLVQEVFLKAWQGLPRLKNPDYFATWLYRITWNVATDQRRRFAKQMKLIDGLEAHLGLRLDARPEELSQIHYQDLVQRGLQSLSLEQRAVVVLHDLKDLSQKEVAEILCIPMGTVKSRLHHGRRSLRQFLEAQGVSL